jgi:hypothetical protein
MYIKNNVIYAGITSEKGLDFINNNSVINTGYVLKRITDGKIFGVSYELQGYEQPEMFIEIDDNEYVNHFEKNRTIIAGVYNEEGFDLCINKENLYTMKKFVRIHDGQEMGNIIYLGQDFSYYYNEGLPRYDLSKYYVEVDDVLENEE